MFQLILFSGNGKQKKILCKKPSWNFTNVLVSDVSNVKGMHFGIVFRKKVKGGNGYVVFS